MPTRKSSEPEQQEGEEPDRVVDPPEASSDDTTDPEQHAEQQWVIVDQSALLTLPSGASYNLMAGNILQMSPEDAAFVINNGYASETEAPSYEPETGFPAEPATEAEAPSEE